MITYHIAGVIALVYCVLSILVTVTRIALRCSHRRWWWDDTCAVVAGVAILIQTIIVHLIWEHPEVVNKVPHLYVSLYYLDSVFSRIQDWAARMAILFSIMSIAVSTRLHRSLYFVAVLFLLAPLVYVGLVIGTCEQEERVTGWASEGSYPQCHFPRAVPIYHIITSTLADTTLVLVPFYILHALTSHPIIRHRLEIIFSASILISVAAIIQAYTVLSDPGAWSLLAGSTEGQIAIIVCNLPVIVPAICRQLGIRNESESHVHEVVTALRLTPDRKTDLESQMPRFSGGSEDETDDETKVDGGTQDGADDDSDRFSFRTALIMPHPLDISEESRRDS